MTWWLSMLSFGEERLHWIALPRWYWLKDSRPSSLSSHHSIPTFIPPRIVTMMNVQEHCASQGWCAYYSCSPLLTLDAFAITFSGEWPSKHDVSPFLSILLSCRSWNGFNGLFFAKVAPARRARRWGLSKRRLGDESSLKKLAVRGLAGRAAWHCARIGYRE